LVGASVFSAGFALVEAGDPSALGLAALGAVVLFAAWAVLRFRPSV
jgi:hypothetical protein